MSNEERLDELLEPWIGHRDCDDACNDKWDGDQLIAELTKLIDKEVEEVSKDAWYETSRLQKQLREEYKKGYIDGGIAEINKNV